MPSERISHTFRNCLHSQPGASSWPAPMLFVSVCITGRPYRSQYWRLMRYQPYTSPVGSILPPGITSCSLRR